LGRAWPRDFIARRAGGPRGERQRSGGHWRDAAEWRRGNTSPRALEGAPIVWIGQRAVHCAAQPRPEAVWPVRVRAGAFGEHGPVRDLYLSPDHAVFVNGVLVPVRLLIDGDSIVQVKRDRVRYFHVELPGHAVILAEGLTVESYLDSGDRADFQDGDGAIRLFPTFGAGRETATAWETRGRRRWCWRGTSWRRHGGRFANARWQAPRLRPGPRAGLCPRVRPDRR